MEEAWLRPELAVLCRAVAVAEMAGVGTLFNKLNAFLVNVEKGQQAGTDAKAPVEGK